jgi:MFS family permease
VATIFKPPCDEGVIRSGRASAPCAAGAGVWVLAATILGSSMAFIDGTVVNVALPVLQRELNATVADVQWIVEAYALFLAALILLGGSLGDHLGRRRVFAAGIALFMLASRRRCSSFAHERLAAPICCCCMPASAARSFMCRST